MYEQAQNTAEVVKVTVASCSCVHAYVHAAVYMFPMMLLAWIMAGWIFELKSRFVPKDLILILMALFMLENDVDGMTSHLVMKLHRFVWLEGTIEKHSFLK